MNLEEAEQKFKNNIGDIEQYILEKIIAMSDDNAKFHILIVSNLRMATKDDDERPVAEIFYDIYKDSEKFSGLIIEEPNEFFRSCSEAGTLYVFISIENYVQKKEKEN